ncbi:MAG: DUF924 domain-containing protein [Alphaproteobacteria bacterium]|nr:DUF924 domain-containing protein [Alphaproteobacteria bacterium]MCB9693463.1 DUF924 domain-containing protein [Alphaproteobacteria bacterium]
MTPEATGRVLTFWFETLGSADWFRSDPGLDAFMAHALGDLHREAGGLDPEDALRDASTALAAVILLDQLSRNLHRGQAAAFANDARALAITRGAVARGLHHELEPARRTFLLMPYMHAEDLQAQDEGLPLFADLPGDHTLRFAQEHRDIVARFGRFPHRNTALGRESTPEELAFLEHGPRYGQ